MPPEQPPAPEPYKFNFWETDPKKNFAPWFIKFCVVLIAIGVGAASSMYYTAYQNYQYGLSMVEQSKTEPRDTPLADFTGWQTYRNEEYGFEFKYPVNFTTSNYEYGTIFESEKRGDIYVGIRDFKFDPNNIMGNYGRVDVNHTVRVRVGNKIGYKYPNGDVCSHEAVDTDLQNKTLSITFVACEESGEVPFTEIEANQILSTFRFIEPTKTEVPIACTADAMMCPDGSYVGRTGPNCEFVCP